MLSSIPLRYYPATVDFLGNFLAIAYFYELPVFDVGLFFCAEVWLNFGEFRIHTYEIHALWFLRVSDTKPVLKI